MSGLCLSSFQVYRFDSDRTNANALGGPIGISTLAFAVAL